MTMIFETLSNENTLMYLGFDLSRIKMFYQTLLEEGELGSKTGIVLDNDEQLVLNVPFDNFVKMYKKSVGDVFYYRDEHQ